jgi:hypothetical protein
VALGAGCKVTVLWDDIIDLTSNVLRVVLTQVHLRGNDTTGISHAKKVIS